ncbi:MAG: nucleotidyltransferase [Ignavibacteria bacterium]|nr:nucleotidyltransferase [Ignavibacteria bacterium]
MAKIPNKIEKKIKQFIGLLEKNNIRINQAILYGSYAKGSANKWSDIDLALISENFEGDRYNDITKLRDFIFSVDTDISPLPYRPEDFTVDDLFVKEIIKTGIRIV